MRVDLARWPSAGRVLAAITVLPALLLASWLIAGVPLLLSGWFRPLPAIVLAAVVLAALCALTLRRLPEVIEASAWQTAGVAGVAAASAVFNGLLHSEVLVVRRDPATYAQYAIWLAEHGSLPIPGQMAAFGGGDLALWFASPGFFLVGSDIVPQFMPGAPLIYALGHWLGGAAGMLLVPAVLGAFAVLTVAGVVARLAGAAWAPLAGLVFGVALPILYTSRATFSEIPSLVLLFGGVVLLLDAHARAVGHGTLRPGRAALARPVGAASARAAAVVAGLVFGLALVVRIDGLRDLMPVLAFAGLLIALGRIARRAPSTGAPAPLALWVGWPGLGIPLLAGLLAGMALGGSTGYLLSEPYLRNLSASLVPLLGICAAVVVLTVAGAWAGPRLHTWIGAAGARWPGLARRLPAVGAGVVVLVTAGFAVRPWVSTVRRFAVTQDDQFNSAFIAQAQRDNGLPIDSTRLYYEDSLYWVIWYVGVPVVVLATLAGALLVRRMLRGGEAAWLLPLAIIGWTTVATLLRPGITPDHPWAARRLVPIVIPGLVILAVWGLGWVKDKARRMGYGGRAQAAVAGVGAVLLLVPPAVTSIGTAFTPVERGERAAVEAMCRKIPADASVLMVERVTGDRFAQVVRGMCGVPVARARSERDTAPPEEVRRVVDRIRGAGRRPVLLAADADQLTPYGTAFKALSLHARQDERSLVEPPNGTWSFSMNVWMVVLDRS
ncbi:hypothetical protein [Sinosporangium siamense]|uniref:Uncharacterized protein n=1 Tax=Sinosporangium siamense TaxID=1367973 RepID=A0A919RBR1_9ACTN|nr:hypothetical protein [Sinosporangium siamense]GII91011.1 hypothetical protein Ssi02_12420 [Sinosporangium siamense]